MRGVPLKLSRIFCGLSLLALVATTAVFAEDDAAKAPAPEGDAAASHPHPGKHKGAKAAAKKAKAHPKPAEAAPAAPETTGEPTKN